MSGSMNVAHSAGQDSKKSDRRFVLIGHDLRNSYRLNPGKC